MMMKIGVVSLDEVRTDDSARLLLRFHRQSRSRGLGIATKR